MSKKYIKITIFRSLVVLLLGLILLIIFVLKSANVSVNEEPLKNAEYANKISLYVLQDGTLRVEQNIELEQGLESYSTYFIESNRYDEVEYNKCVENLKVYCNDIQLDTNENVNGYFKYKYNNKVLNSKEVELRFSEFNNIEIIMPNNKSNLKIVYELKDYIINYNDVNYFQYNLKYNFNVFKDTAQINIIMPDNTKIFSVNNNIEFKNISIIDVNDSKQKMIYLNGLCKNTLHLDVLFDKELVDSSLKINENKYEEISQKFYKMHKQQTHLYTILFVCIIIYSIASACLRSINIYVREKRGRIYKFNIISFAIEIVICMYIIYNFAKLI